MLNYSYVGQIIEILTRSGEIGSHFYAEQQQFKQLPHYSFTLNLKSS